MIVLAALLLGLQAVPAEASPDRATLDAFRAACDRVNDFDHMVADVRASGWEPVAEDAHPQLAELNRLGRESMGGEGTIRGSSYRRPVGGRTLYLIASRYEDRSGFWGNGCRLYDFDAPARIEPATLEQWMGRAPTGTQAVPDAGTKLLWEPAWRSGVTIEVNYVPAASQLRTLFGLSGNILVAQAIGGF